MQTYDEIVLWTVPFGECDVDVDLRCEFDLQPREPVVMWGPNAHPGCDESIENLSVSARLGPSPDASLNWVEYDVRDIGDLEDHLSGEVDRDEDWR